MNNLKIRSGANVEIAACLDEIDLLFLEQNAVTDEITACLNNIELHTHEYLDARIDKHLALSEELKRKFWDLAMIVRTHRKEILEKL